MMVRRGGDDDDETTRIDHVVTSIMVNAPPGAHPVKPTAPVFASMCSPTLPLRPVRCPALADEPFRSWLLAGIVHLRGLR